MRALIEFQDLRRWSGASQALVQPCKGGVYTLTWDREDGGIVCAASGVVKSFLPDKRLRIDSLVFLDGERGILGPMRLSFNLAPREGGTRLSVRQDGIGEGPLWDWYHDSVLQGWKDSLLRIKKFLEGEEDRPNVLPG